MIFLTVGTTRFPFDRLLKAVDEALVEIDPEEELIAQVGISNYRFQYSKAKVFKEIPFYKMIEFFKKARVVITHGGPATIFLVLKYGKNRPLVVPRLSIFKEHVNNHQVIFAKDLSRRNLIKVLLPEENLIEGMINYLKNPEKSEKRRDLKSSSKLVKKLIRYTEELE